MKTTERKKSKNDKINRLHCNANEKFLKIKTIWLDARENFLSNFFQLISNFHAWISTQ